MVAVDPSVRSAKRIPLWVTAITAGLLLLGFRRHRFATSYTRRRAELFEADRGRFAKTPSEIPKRGWKDILWRVYTRITECRVIAVAAGVTFYALLAIFPAIAALISIYGLFSDPGTIAGHLDSISSFVPGGAIDVIRDQMNRVASQGAGTLGLAFIVGLGISLWSANAGIKAMFDALNVVYGENEKRSFIRLNLISLSLTLAAIGFLLLALALIAVVPLALKYLGLESATQWIIAASRWPLLFIAVSLGLAVLYRYGPGRNEPQWRWVTPGSMFAALVWIAVSLLFSWYAENFGSYNKTYGSLGAIIGFMTWIWLSTIVILAGAAIDAEMEHQTVRDTTVTGPKRMGQRGATMADTVGAAQG
jgi:membrane protein